MGSQFISQIKEYCNFFYKNIFTHPYVYVYVWIGLCFISVFLNAEVSTIEILLNLCIFHLIHFLEIFSYYSLFHVMVAEYSIIQNIITQLTRTQVFLDGFFRYFHCFVLPFLISVINGIYIFINFIHTHKYKQFFINLWAIYSFL